MTVKHLLLILDRSFWFELKELGDVFNELDGILKMAETKTASLSRVFSSRESHLEHIMRIPRGRFEEWPRGSLCQTQLSRSFS
jgi:hypothetical protein